ncbi:hypothetical protein [Aquimarina sp. AU474]|uniref:hypothetical protein n=1 Tax=Aquimarina sp. AU474 TaxID=2108529 RepID=UPI000D686D16|nr:hypothetical protein [Aquimarina sp. AU474]
MATKNTPQRSNVTSTKTIQEAVKDPAEKLFDEIKKALHGGKGSKQWSLPPQNNKVECIVPIIIE